MLFIFCLAGLGGTYVFFHPKKEAINQSSFERADANALEWEELQSLDVQSLSIPPTIQALNGKQVKIPGFIIPLEDNQDVIHDFLFVPSPMACIHVPPPPPNQIIHVTMASGKAAKMSYGPVWLFGTLILAENQGKTIRNSYEMVGIATEPYQ